MGDDALSAGLTLGRRIHCVGLRTVEVFQIWFDEQSAKCLDPLATPFLDRHCSPYFESDVIRKVVPRASSSVVGVVGWKFISKTGKCVTDLLDSVARNPDNSVFSATSVAGLADMWAQGDLHHPGIAEVARRLLKKLGVPFHFGDPIPAIYCNFFAGTNDVYHKYVEDLLLPVIDLMENDPDISVMAQQPCDYPNGLAAETLYKSTGMRAYTFRPFICERLFPTFCAINGISVSSW